MFVEVIDADIEEVFTLDFARMDGFDLDSVTRDGEV